jgi:hypothetical protein
MALIPVAALADKLETTHLFGFTLGSDVNDVGEKEAESETPDASESATVLMLRSLRALA